MNLLEGSIAFALALAGLATLCTVLIEILHRAAGLRADGLKQMLDAYFDAVIKPRLASGDVDNLRKDLLAKLTNSALLEKIHPVSSGWRGLIGRSLGALYRGRLLRANAVTTEEFLQRLPDSDLYKQLKTDAAEQTDALIKELADKYDQYGAAAKDYFKRRAQLLSILLGIALALFANIHAVRIFDTFVKNPDLAQRMEAQAGAIKLVIDQQAAPDGAQVEEINEKMDKVIATLQDYQELGLPIGWSYYPNCFGAGAGDPRCKPVLEATSKSAAQCKVESIRKTFARDPAAALLWLFTVIFTGILIGLGGPFWFDLAMRLSQVRQAISGRPAAQAEAAPAPTSPRDQAIAYASSKLAPAAQASQPATSSQGRHPWDDKPW